MARFLELIWGGSEAEYFCERDWTGQISLKLLRKIAQSRIRPPGNRKFLDILEQKNTYLI